MNNQKELLEKIEFYRCNEIKCHVNVVPKGKFYNGMFLSKLMDEKFFMFMGDDGIPFRIFLNEIYSVEDYKEWGDGR